VWGRSREGRGGLKKNVGKKSKKTGNYSFRSMTKKLLAPGGPAEGTLKTNLDFRKGYDNWYVNRRAIYRKLGNKSKERSSNYQIIPKLEGETGRARSWRRGGQQEGKGAILRSPKKRKEVTFCPSTIKRWQGQKGGKRHGTIGAPV